MKRFAVINLLGLLLFSGAVNAGAYKCKDVSGKVSYQSAPCAAEDTSTSIETGTNEVSAEEGTKTNDASDGFFKSSQLYGTWCFYEQEALGNVVKDNITIKLNKDGTYHWSDIRGWDQDGTWSLTDNKLKMSFVGTHDLVSVTANKIEMIRYSTMRMRRGAC